MKNEIAEKYAKEFIDDLQNSEGHNCKKYGLNANPRTEIECGEIDCVKLQEFILSAFDEYETEKMKAAEQLAELVKSEKDVTQEDIGAVVETLLGSGQIKSQVLLKHKWDEIVEKARKITEGEDGQN